MWITIWFWGLTIFLYLVNKWAGKPTDITSKGLNVRGKILFYFCLVVSIIRTIGHIFGIIE